ncbi:hypothetical protein GCM10028791_40920 [Echinicola sediminis]
MKLSINNLLRGGIFAVAMVAAFAFTKPKQMSSEFGLSNGVWYDVTNINPGSTTYTCDSEPDVECLFDAPHGSGSPISPDEDREFVKRGELPEAE